MKTNQTVSAKFKSVLSGFTFIMIALFITGCEKDEPAKPFDSSTISLDKKPSWDQVSCKTMAFTSIKINHRPGRGFAPDYAVTINSDGNVWFEGRRNVFITRTVNYQLNQNQLNAINKICIAVNFFNLDVMHKLAPNGMIDAAFVETTFTAKQRTKTLSDYNDGSFVQLESFKKKVEAELGLERFINGKKITIDPSNITK